MTPRDEPVAGARPNARAAARLPTKGRKRHKLLLLIGAFHDAGCDPSVRMLAARSGFTTATVIRLLGALERDGLLEVERRPSPERDRYTLRHPSRGASVSGRQNRDGSVVGPQGAQPVPVGERIRQLLDEAPRTAGGLPRAFSHFELARRRLRHRQPDRRPAERRAPRDRQARRTAARQSARRSTASSRAGNTRPACTPTRGATVTGSRAPAGSATLPASSSAVCRPPPTARPAQPSKRPPVRGPRREIEGRLARPR